MDSATARFDRGIPTSLPRDRGGGTSLVRLDFGRVHDCRTRPVLTPEVFGHDEVTCARWSEVDGIYGKVERLTCLAPPIAGSKYGVRAGHEVTRLAAPIAS